MRNKREIDCGKHTKDVEDHIGRVKTKYKKISSNKERSIHSIHDTKNRKHSKWNIKFEKLNKNIIARFEKATETFNLSNKGESKDSFVLSSEGKSPVFDALAFTSSLEKPIGYEHFEQEDYPENVDGDISEEENDSRNLFKVDSTDNDKDEVSYRERCSIETDSDFYTPRSIDAKNISATEVRDLEDIDLQIQKNSVMSGSVARERHKKETTYKLPYWCQKFAWFLCFVAVVTSASFTFFYSLMWRKEIANQWLSSMFVSFVQDLFLNQPIKMFIWTLIFACILKNPANEMTEWDNIDKVRCNITTSSSSNDVKIVMPDEGQLKKAREYKKNQTKMLFMAREIVTYVIFLFLLMIVCYGNRTENGFLMTENIKNIFGDFYEIGNSEEFFTWVNESFIRNLHSGEWYNGVKETIDKSIGDKQSLLVGMPSLRQLRVQEGSCEVADQVKMLITQCHDFYSFKEEEEVLFSLPGWQPLNSTLHTSPTDVSPKPWRYLSQETLNGAPVYGYFTFYDGGGYIADLGYDPVTAKAMLEDLIAYRWIDKKSRAVIVEFTIFNTNTNYISFCSFFYEILPTGYRSKFTKIESIALYHTDSSSFDLWLVCQFIFMGMLVYYVSLQIYRIWKQKGRYFKQFGNWIEIAQIIIALLAIAFYMAKESTIPGLVLAFQNNPYEKLAFYKVIRLVDTENILLSFAVLIGTIKLLGLVRLNSQINLILSSLYVSRAPLLSFGFILFVIIASFSQAGYLIFGSTVKGYSTYIRSLCSEMEMTIGGNINLVELQNANRILGPLFAFSFLTIMAFLLLNIFVAIINKSYKEMKTNPYSILKKYEFGKFIRNRVKRIFSRKQSKDSASLKAQKNYSVGEHLYSSSNNFKEYTLFSKNKKKVFRLCNQLQLLEDLVEKLDKKVEELWAVEEKDSFFLEELKQLALKF